jgi:hypothetical protein
MKAVFWRGCAMGVCVSICLFVCLSVRVCSHVWRVFCRCGGSYSTIFDGEKEQRLYVRRARAAAMIDMPMLMPVPMPMPILMSTLVSNELNKSVLM